MKLERISAVLLVACALGAGFVGCGDDSAEGSGGSGTTSSTTTTTVTSGGVNDQYLALPCEADSECGPSGRCILSSVDNALFGGGPAGGYCTRTCNSDSDCGGATGVRNLCVQDENGESYCLLGCEQGTPPLVSLDTPLDEDKCRGRDDLRCDTVLVAEEEIPICLPSCGVDAQCDGRACDPRYTVCVDTPNPGLPDGDECTAGNNPCAGYCVNFTDVHMCSSPCVMGGDIEVDCGGLTHGLCAYASDSTGAGDLGFCTEACLAQDDCLNPYFWCLGVNNLTGSAVPNGYCLGATECPNGQSQCKTGQTCTDTPHGHFCLDPRFPLTSSGAGGGGTGGGGGAGGGG